MVDKSVDRVSDAGAISEDFSPSAERLVAGDDEMGSSVAGGDEVDEQVRSYGLEG